MTIPVSTNPCVNKISENLSKGNNPLGDCDSLLNLFQILIQTAIRRAENHLFRTTEIHTLKLHKYFIARRAIKFAALMRALSRELLVCQFEQKSYIVNIEFPAGFNFRGVT